MAAPRPNFSSVNVINPFEAAQRGLSSAADVWANRDKLIMAKEEQAAKEAERAANEKFRRDQLAETIANRKADELFRRDQLAETRANREGDEKYRADMYKLAEGEDRRKAAEFYMRGFIPDEGLVSRVVTPAKEGQIDKTALTDIEAAGDKLLALNTADKPIPTTPEQKAAIKTAYQDGYRELYAAYKSGKLTPAEFSAKHEELKRSTVTPYRDASSIDSEKTALQNYIDKRTSDLVNKYNITKTDEVIEKAAPDKQSMLVGAISKAEKQLGRPLTIEERGALGANVANAHDALVERAYKDRYAAMQYGSNKETADDKEMAKVRADLKRRELGLLGEKGDSADFSKELAALSKSSVGLLPSQYDDAVETVAEARRRGYSSKQIKQGLVAASNNPLFFGDKGFDSDKFFDFLEASNVKKED